MCQDRPVDHLLANRGTTTMLQQLILADILRTERAIDESPIREERRRHAHLLDELRCRSGPSLATRLLGAFRAPATACCAAA